MCVWELFVSKQVIEDWAEEGIVLDAYNELMININIILKLM